MLSHIDVTVLIRPELLFFSFHLAHMMLLAFITMFEKCQDNDYGN